MFDRFTDRARKVMGLARQEAQRFNHDYIGTEHILLGLMEEGSGVAASVLKNLGCDRDSIRSAVLKHVSVGHGDPNRLIGQFPFTPRAKKVLELSLASAAKLGHTYIGTEHLLLGLISEDHGFAAQALISAGLTAEDVCRETLQMLGADSAEVKGFDLQEIDKIRERPSLDLTQRRWLATYDALRKDLELKETAHRAAVSRQFATENAVDRFLSALDALRAHRRLH
jgi:ATP-dependent Clp protease ATP-binding subunit ClpC